MAHPLRKSTAVFAALVLVMMSTPHSPAFAAQSANQSRSQTSVRTLAPARGHRTGRHLGTRLIVARPAPAPCAHCFRFPLIIGIAY
jgi:hypothetical protein